MPRITQRIPVKRDILAQWVWYVENADLETANRFVAAVEETIALLAAQPQAGSHLFAWSPQLQGLRKFPVGGGFRNFLIIYKPLADGISVLRVIHGSRDLRVLFESS